MEIFLRKKCRMIFDGIRRKAELTLLEGKYYTRIETEAGGRSACARREGEYKAQQRENGKERQRGAKPPMPRVPYKGSEGKEINEGRRGEIECMHA